jgi:hypothetical protein
MTHTLRGSSSANPNSQSFSNFPSKIQFTTRAVTPVLAGRPSKHTAVPISRGRPNSAAHPWGFTKITKHSPENGWDGSRTVRVTGISHGIRVPRRRPAFLSVGRTFKSIGSRDTTSKVPRPTFGFRN